MKKRGKKYEAAAKKVTANKNYTLADASKLVKQLSYVKFDPTIEVALNLGVDPRHADQNVRGAVVLPHGLGKKVRVAVFTKGEKVKEAEAAGADIVGGQELIDKVNAGFVDFEAAIATPDMMGAVGKIGKILAPRGLMPNPKVGTVTMNVGEAVKAAKAGRIEFKVNKAGIIHCPAGKLSMSEQALEENIRTLITTVVKAKPATAKGTYLKAVYVSSSMSPSIKLETEEFKL